MLLLSHDFLRPECTGMQKVPLAVSPGLIWQLPIHEQTDWTLPGFWELLVWKVGRGVEDIAESRGQGGK